MARIYIPASLLGQGKDKVSQSGNRFMLVDGNNSIPDLFPYSLPHILVPYIYRSLHLGPVDAYHAVKKTDSVTECRVVVK